MGRPQRGAQGEWTRCLQPEELWEDGRGEQSGQGNSAGLSVPNGLLQSRAGAGGGRIANGCKENEANGGSDLL